MVVKVRGVHTGATVKTSLEYVCSVNNYGKGIADNAKLVSYNMATPREA